MKKKIFLTITAFILSLLLAFCVAWTVINFDTVKKTMSGTQLYTFEDVTNSFNDGYAQGIINEENLVAELEDHKSLVNVLTEQVKVLESTKSALEEEVSGLKSLSSSYEVRISNLTAEKERLESDLVAANSIIDDLYEKLYGEYVDPDEGQNEDLLYQIHLLEVQIESLEESCSALDSENESLFYENIEFRKRISVLEDEIFSLNKISSTLRDQLIALGETPEA